MRVFKAAYKGSRDEQQDACAVRRDGDTTIFGVFDGLGGHAHGRAAARAAARSLQASENTEPDKLHAKIRTAVERSGGSTTASIAYLTPTDGGYEVHVYNVGDSPVYQINPDGTIDELHHDAYPGECFTKCLPPDMIRHRHTGFIPKHGDEGEGYRLLVCTDGVLYGDVVNLVVSTRDDYAAWAKELSQRPGSDNVTFIMVEVD